MKKEVTICYSYKEGRFWWLVYGNEEDILGPSEKSFSTKKALDEWVEDNLKVVLERN